MAHHKAIVTVAKRAPLEYLELETPTPEGKDVLVQVSWTSASPLNLHIADGGLGNRHPDVMTGEITGVVKQVGPDVKHFAVGEAVFGWGFATQEEKGWQEYVRLSENNLAKLLPSLTPEEAVTIPTNFVTAWHLLVTDLGLTLPWPKPANYKPADDEGILVWGGASSSGQFTIQVLKYFGFSNIVAVASKRQHELLRGLGATKTLDYNDVDVESQIKALDKVRRFADCIGSRDKSLAHIAAVAEPGCIVSVLMPVIVRDATDTLEPQYSPDPNDVGLPWKAGVQVNGVRTHNYQQNAFHAEVLQRVIMPELIKEGVIAPNKVRIVEGKDSLESAQKALQLLRDRAVSGEKLVFKIG